MITKTLFLKIVQIFGIKSNVLPIAYIGHVILLADKIFLIHF